VSILFVSGREQVQHIVHGFGKRDGLNEPKSGQADAVRERTQRKAFLRELDAMIRLRHPHTVNVFGAITSLTDRLILVMELLAGGDLRTMLRNSEQPLPEDRCRQIIKDICAGMAFLHSKSTVHGDLKSANVLLDARGRAKVSWARARGGVFFEVCRSPSTVGSRLSFRCPLFRLPQFGVQRCSKVLALCFPSQNKPFRFVSTFSYNSGLIQIDNDFPWSRKHPRSA